ncbi:MAG: serine/threonine protein kinase [Oxalobacter sp.]|nr:MAG: serine/threonine protein kinase [Oxalobacter sp.]
MATQNNAPLPEGLEIGGYRIVKKIASGGFSMVYLAYDEEGNAVAIKEYLPSALALRNEGELVSHVSAANLPIFHIGLKCFFEEGRALARIAHPNVVRVLNFFRANETVYMVMAYESGRTLQEHILHRRDKGVKPLMSERFIRNTFAQVINGLREVHANKLLHLDLKPANIYLRIEGTPILLDFGAARQTLNTSGTNKLNPMYTPGFAPPELYSKTGNIGPWTDIYGVGASIFACMAGIPPQPWDQRKAHDKMDEYLKKLDSLFTPEIVEIVRTCLKIDHMERPQSLFELQKSLLAPVNASETSTRSQISSIKGRLRSLFAKEKREGTTTIVKE